MARTTWCKRSTRGAIVLLVVLAGTAALGSSPAAATNGAVLIYEGSVWPGTVTDPNASGGGDGGTLPLVSLEQEQAELAGEHVVTANDQEWRGLTMQDFAAYDAIVLGDAGCARTVPPALLATRAVWGPAVTGNVIAVGTDPTWNYFLGLSGAINPFALQVTASAIAYAVGAPGATGLYVSLSCYYGNATAPVDVPLLDALGAFKAHKADCTHDGHLVTAFDGMLGDGNLGLWWDCSAHEVFDVYPATFQPLAVLGDGSPYILTRGAAATAADTDAPTIALTTPTDGAVIARGAVVAAEYGCADTGGSGLAACAGDVPSGSPIDTAALGPHTFTVHAEDGAGNVADVQHGYTVVDATSPTVTLTTPPAGAVYTLNQPVSASYACADEAGGSGVGSCVGDVANGGAVDTSTAGPHTFTVTAADGAGNTTTVQNGYTVAADTTAPTIALTSPVEGATYTLKQVVRAAYGCADTGGSGLARCAGNVAGGAAIDTAKAGPHTFTVDAVDRAGNASSLTIHYTVASSSGKTPVCSVTGEGRVGSASFELEVRGGSSRPSGSLSFSDRAARHSLRSTSISTLTCNGSTAVVTGTGADNGRTVAFTLNVTAGRAGTLSVGWSGYAAAGTITDGSVRIRLGGNADDD
jgi:hypothetical protein